MKKLFAVLVLLFAVAFIGAPICANTAYADQGLYGIVWAWAHGVNDCYVDNAVVKVYNNSHTYITQTTASICGYYTVSLSPGYYYLVVGGTYNEREKDNCGNIVATEYVAGDTNIVHVGSGFWVELDIETD